jgi:hypothetical protein
MAPKPLTDELLRDSWNTFASYGYNMMRAADALGVPAPSLRHRIKVAMQRFKLSIPEQRAGSVHATKARKLGLPEPGKVARYIVTSAQSNTSVHEPTWAALLALAEWYKADVLVSTFRYVMANEGSAKRGSVRESGRDEWYAPEIEPFICDDLVELAPGLMFCGNMNTLPTAERPLRGFESYTGRASGIFPHPRQHMVSVASHKQDPTKFNWSTGTVTKRHYLQKRAGIRAEFHHCYGALLVEIDSKGRWFVRQLASDNAGRVYDLNVVATAEGVEHHDGVEAITWGDLHVERANSVVRALAWGKGGMLDTLRPKRQFIHDLLDFHARSHHEMRDPHAMFERWIEGTDSVAEALMKAAAFLGDEAFRSWCETIVVCSNHDNHLERWLREADYKHDHRNAVTFLRLQLAKYEAIAERDKRFLMLEHALRAMCGLKPSAARFLRHDESYIICRDGHGGIECGMHGDDGPNGARGSISNLTRMGRKANIGHSHSAGILDGVFQAGTSSDMDLGYNRGPGSWSHSHVVTYPNGKRTMVTMWGGAWRAA